MTRQRLRLALLPLLACLFGAAAHSQATRIGSGCDLAAVGENGKSGFLAFDKELRSALSTHDVGAVALLVNYPLRVGDDRGRYFIPDAASLQGRFDDIFTPAVRDVILKQSLDGIFCKSGGIMYGRGEIWVTATGQHRYAIETVNVPAASHEETPKPGKVEVTCDAAKYRIVVESGEDGRPRLRAWTKPRSLTEKPDIEIPHGTDELQGTGPCLHPVWTFKTNAMQFVVEGIGCTEEQPPAAATATLDVSPGSTAQEDWCY